MDPVTLVVGGVVALLALITVARPQLLGAAWVRWTGWLRFWERAMMHSKEGYVAIKDKKIDQLRRSSDEIMDGLATLRGKVKTLKNQHDALQVKEDRFRNTRELLVKKAEAAQGTPGFDKLAQEVDTLDRDVAKIDTEQSALEEQIGELTEEVELTAPYLDEVTDLVKKTAMERDLGLIKIETAKLKEERARRLGRLAGVGHTMVDKLEAEADEYLQKTVERGKIADERVSTDSEAIVMRHEKETRTKSAAERLSAELAQRRGEVSAPAVPASPEQERLTK